MTDTVPNRHRAVGAIGVLGGLIFGIGASFSISSFAAPIPKGKVAVQLTVDDCDLNKDYTAQHLVVGDAKLVLRQMIQEVQRQLGADGRRSDGRVARQIKAVKDEWLAEWMPRLTSEEVPINPYRVVWDLQHALADFLGKQKAKVSLTARPDIDTAEAHRTYVFLLRAATAGRQTPEEFRRNAEIARGLAPDDERYYARMMRANTASHRDWLAANELRHKMRWRWAEFFREWDLLLCPAAASAAFPHDHVGERHDRTIVVNARRVPTTDQLFWAGYSGVAYLPSTVAPCGFPPGGLPVGVQIVGPQYGDRTCIELARLLLGASSGAVRRALAELGARVGEAKGRGERTLLLVYYSGHAKDGALRLGGGTIPLDELRAALERAPADVRIGLLDSCRSGAIARTKGARPAPSFDVRTGPEPGPSGLVLIASSAAGEDSQESDAVGASWFTHHLASGLLGGADASGDGRVTLSEAYAYAYARTVGSTASSAGGVQHPVFLYELGGAGDVVLADLAPVSGRLVFPAPAEGLYVVLDRAGRAVAEVAKGAGSERRIALFALNRCAAQASACSA